MFLPTPLLRRVILLIAIAVGVLCAERSAQAGVITETNGSDSLLIGYLDSPTGTPSDSALDDGTGCDVASIPVSGSGGSPVGLDSGSIKLADVVATGRSSIVDPMLPDDPFLRGLPRPA